MHIPLDPASPDPIYDQIRRGIAAAIDRGELVAGEPLPSIRALARDLRVSVITTTRAYTELVAEGYVDTVRGKGVFVREQDAGQVRERALAQIREHLAAAVLAARPARIDIAEIHELLDRTAEEDR